MTKDEAEKKALSVCEAVNMYVEKGEWFVECSEKCLVEEISKLLLSESFIVQKRVEELQALADNNNSLLCKEIETSFNLTEGICKLQKQIDELNAKLVGFKDYPFKNVKELQEAWEELDNERKSKIDELTKENERLRREAGLI